jgi:hypothetical protein
MKKMFIALMLLIGMIPLIGMSVFASTEDSLQVDQEEFYLEDYLTINGEQLTDYYYSTGYYTLIMGLGNVLDIDVQAAIEDLPYFDGDYDNISNIYIRVELDEYYTSAPDPYWNFSDPNLSSPEENVLIYNLNSSDLDDNVNFVFWWANEGSSGGAPYTDTGGIRFLSATLYLEYYEPVYTVDFEYLVECGNNYDLLPETNGVFTTILFMQEYDMGTHSYHMKFLYEDSLYTFDVAIPAEIYDYNYDSPYIREGVTFSDFLPGQLSYASDDDGNKVIYIQPVSQFSNYPVINDTEDAMLIVGFATINLTTMEFEIINKLELISVINKEENRYAYLYCFFPAEIEDLLSITVTYDFRQNYIFGIHGEWQTAVETYVHGEGTEGAVPNWIWWIPAFGWGWGIGSAITGNAIYDVDENIQTLQEQDVPDEVVYRYVNDLGGSTFDLNDLALYKVTLGQFQDGIFTNVTDQNAYDIQDLVVTEILYMFDGKVYTAYTDQIISLVSNPELVQNFYERISEVTSGISLGIDSSWMSYAAIIVVALVILWLGNKVLNTIKRSRRASYRYSRYRQRR